MERQKGLRRGTRLEGKRRTSQTNDSSVILDRSERKEEEKTSNEELQ